MQAKLLCKAPEDYKALPSLIQSYQELEGSLMHLMVKTRPDICFAVSRLGQFASNPTQEHYNALKRVVRYIAGTQDRGIYFNSTLIDPSISAWSDASWAEDLDDSNRRQALLSYSITRLLCGKATNKHALPGHPRKPNTLANQTPPRPYHGLGLS